MKTTALRSLDYVLDAALRALAGVVGSTGPRSTHENCEHVQQCEFVVPDLTVQDLLSSIPGHCLQRSALRSFSYVAWDIFVIGAAYELASVADSFVQGQLDPFTPVFALARYAIWTFYSFIAGLFATGLWIIAHECGHQAFSESKTINNAVGWILHSALGVPYHSWRITHAKHHASTGHMLYDQAFVPKTRTKHRLPPRKNGKEDVWGSYVAKEVQRELRDALGDSPIGAAIGSSVYLLGGWFFYLLFNASGQSRYPPGTNHFTPNSVVFAKHQRHMILWSNFGVLLWLASIGAGIGHFGFSTVFVTYLAPYLWVNHWIVLITFLQHTDPLVPHYRSGQYTFPRGALSTLDRSLMGDLGWLPGWLGAHATHGIAETHVLHHVCSRIPHYHAWEASIALHETLRRAGLDLRGAPAGWAEIYRVYKECRFVEDDGDVVFYKNGRGLAQARPVLKDASDSGVEIDK